MKHRIFALLPFFVFVVIFAGAGIISKDFYSMPAYVAFLTALFIGFLQNKKRPHLGDVLVLFFCSEWCEWYACFIEDSYLAIVEPVISCIERFFNGV